MMKKYRQKPIEIEAIQYDGTNAKEVAEFAGRTIDPCTRNPEYLILEETSRSRSLTMYKGDWYMKHPVYGFTIISDSNFKQTFELVEL